MNTQNAQWLFYSQLAERDTEIAQLKARLKDAEEVITAAREVAKDVKENYMLHLPLDVCKLEAALAKHGEE